MTLFDECLDERQQKARGLADAITRMGAFVISPPGNPNRVRFQVLEPDRNRILQTLKDWEWSPVFVNMMLLLFGRGSRFGE